MDRNAISTTISVALTAACALPVGAQEILPFPPKPSDSVAGRTMQESIYSPLPAVNRLPKARFGAPVGIEYYDQGPFKFNGRIEQAYVEYIK